MDGGTFVISSEIVLLVLAVKLCLLNKATKQVDLSSLVAALRVASEEPNVARQETYC